MTQDFSWNKTIGMINGYQATKISQVGKDGNNTSIETYLKKFGGYDVSGFTGNSRIAKN